MVATLPTAQYEFLSDEHFDRARVEIYKNSFAAQSHHRHGRLVRIRLEQSEIPFVYERRERSQSVAGSLSHECHSAHRH